MQEINDHINSVCVHLEKTVLSMGISIDKSSQSVDILEDILVALIQEGDQGAINGCRYLAGIYLGEILIKNAGGEWIKSEVTNNYAVSCNERLLYPLEQVEEFIKNREAGSLSFFIKGASIVLNSKDLTTKKW